jgi:ubiquinone/menaquinone biosynthesis C-methylase UbiE
MSVTVDFQAIKHRQQGVWASGDYASVASIIVPMAELLCDEADLRAGDRVLDVACGSGNGVIAAARRGCDVTGLDYVPALLARAQERAALEGLEVSLVEGDAEALQFGDGEFDRVLSIVGVMFAPDQEQAAAELLRVCRPGGTIALASWTPEGFIGELLRLVGSYVPPPPGVRPPTLWGTEEHVHRVLSNVSSIHTQRRVLTFRFRSADEFTDFMLTRYGPTLHAFAAMEPTQQDTFREVFADLVRSYDDDTPGSIAVPSEYLVVIAKP